MPKVNARYVDTPAHLWWVGGSFEKSWPPVWWSGEHSEDAEDSGPYSGPICSALSVCELDYEQTFMESLILAQDERWRRA